MPVLIVLTWLDFGSDCMNDIIQLGQVSRINFEFSCVDVVEMFLKISGVCYALVYIECTLDILPLDRLTLLYIEILGSLSDSRRLRLKEREYRDN